jgi:Family of unknown function (DUF6058)
LRRGAARPIISSDTLDVISTSTPLPELSPEDEAYIRGEFFPLEDLCLGRQGHASDYRNRIRSGELPLPTYVIDSVEYYPSDYFLFPDSIEPGSNIKEAFFARYQRIAAAYNESPSTNRVKQEYEGYLSGEYGVCLKTVTPETIFLKGFVMARIDELFENPEPFDQTWRSKLRGLVYRLDGLERQFAPCDTARFGSLPSRVRYIDRARKEYPEAFI